MRLDNVGGEARSEGAITVIDTGVPDFSRMRRSDYDGRFALLLVDGRPRALVRPYLALLVDDVRLFQ